MSEATYEVVGPKSVFGVEPGGVSNFEGVDPQALRALVAAGHIDYVQSSSDAPSAPAVQQQALPAGTADDNKEGADG